MTSPVTVRPRSSLKGRLLRRILVVLIAIGVAGLIGWGFVAGRGEAAKEAERERPIAAPPRVSEVDGHPAVKLDAQTRERSGIEVAALSPARFQAQVRGYGTVLDLSPLTDLGNNYTNARAQLQTAQAKLAASKAAFDRARGLYQHQQNVSLAQFQAAEASLQADEAALSAAESQVRTLIATVVQAFGAVIGKALQDGSPLISRLIDRLDLLVQVTLPPGVAVASPPQTATVQADSGSSTPVSFFSAASRTDPRIQGVSFIYLASADHGVLPGMNVLVLLPSGPPSEGLVIPPSAIVWWQDRAWIYRKTAKDLFVRSQVATDLPTPAGGFVVGSLPAGAEIVTHGAQALLSEEFRAQLQIKAD